MKECLYARLMRMRLMSSVVDRSPCGAGGVSPWLWDQLRGLIKEPTVSSPEAPTAVYPMRIKAAQSSYLVRVDEILASDGWYPCAEELRYKEECVMYELSVCQIDAVSGAEVTPGSGEFSISCCSVSFFGFTFSLDAFTAVFQPMDMEAFGRYEAARTGNKTI